LAALTCISCLAECLSMIAADRRVLRSSVDGFFPRA